MMNVETRRVGFSFYPSFSIPHPFFCGVAKLVRHRTVNAAMRRFESFRHSQINQFADPELE
jgi:hypothetical protein